MDHSYPSIHNRAPNATRSITLVNTKLLTNNWNQIHIKHPDVTTIELTTSIGKIRLFNIYNNCKNNDALNNISTLVKDNLASRSVTNPTHYIWLGNFNQHHPIWDKPRNSHLFTKRNLDLAQPLLDMLNKYKMKMALPPHIPTLQLHSTGNHTRTDNVFCNKDLLDSFIKCDTDDASHPIETDHYPIITQLDISTEKSNLTPKLNFWDIDWDKLQVTFKENLENLPWPTIIKDIPTFKCKLDELNKAMWDTINKHISLSKVCPYSKRWWMHKLTKEKRVTMRLGGWAKTFQFCTAHPIHEQYQNQCNKYAKLLRKTKTSHWDEWLEELNESNVWQASKFIATPPTDAAKFCILTL